MCVSLTSSSGALVGSRRPTVSLALQALDSDGVLSRLEDDRWKLAHGSIPSSETPVSER